MSPRELSVFRSCSTADYACDLARDQAMDKETALIQAGQEFDALLPGSFLRVIEAGACAVGVLWYLTEETDGVHHVFVNDFVISPQHRRRGYALAALDSLAREARTLGCTEIRLYVSDSNQPAWALYKRSGFRLLRPAHAGAWLFKTIV